MKTTILKAGIVGALLAVALGAGVTTADASDSGETIIELRIWQHVDDAEDIWVSAREQGGRWDTLGTRRFPLQGETNGYLTRSLHRYGDLAVGDVWLRFWQRATHPEQFFVRVCAGSCPALGFLSGWRLRWEPLGMLPLPLDDGHSSSGRYQYGNLTVAIPANNPGLLADRERLLSLKEALEGDLSEEARLNWNAGTSTSAWEGVVAGGTPPRITKLELADRGLAGEMWGWLGDLEELVELRLERNQLTGLVPSKLAQLSNLTHVYLGGNELEGCLPSSLRSVPESDVATLGLSDCTPGSADQQTFNFLRVSYQPRALVFDIPPGTTISFPESGCDPTTSHHPVHSYSFLSESPECGTAIALHGRGLPPGIWIFWSFRDGAELERSHFPLDGQPGTLLTQVSASIWRTSLEAVGLR